MDGNNENNLCKKRKQIRKRIRRQQIEKYFELRRKEFECQAYHSQYQQQLKQTLKQTENRQYFLSEISIQLNKIPMSQWIDIIQKIQVSLTCFEGNFNIWTKYGILDALAKTIKIQYFQFDYQHHIAKIFSFILNLTKQLKYDMGLYLVKTQIIENTIIFIKRSNLPLRQQGDFVQLLSVFCQINQKIRDGIITRGGGEILVKYGQKVIKCRQNEELHYKFLGFCTYFLTGFVKTNRRYFPNFQFISSILPLIIDLLKERESQRTIHLSLLCLQLTIKSNPPTYTKKIFQNNILPYLFQFALNPTFLTTSLNILNYISISQQLGKMGILNLLFKINSSEQKISSQVTILTLNMLDNLTVKQQQVNELINHSIWQLACKYLHHNNFDVRSYAYHLVNSIITTVNTQEYKYFILKSYKFIDTIISQLLDFKKIPEDLILQVLSLLKKYIMLQNSINKGRSFKFLQSIYKITSILSYISEQVHNQHVIEQSNIIYTLFIGEQVDSEQNQT